MPVAPGVNCGLFSATAAGVIPARQTAVVPMASSRRVLRMSIPTTEDRTGQRPLSVDSAPLTVRLAQGSIDRIAPQEEDPPVKVPGDLQRPGRVRQWALANCSSSVEPFSAT